MMVLVVPADSRDMGDNRDAGLVENGFVAEAGPLEKQWGPESATGANYKLPGLDSLNIGVVILEGRVWLELNTHGSFALEQYLDNLGLNKDVEVWVCSIFQPRMQVVTGGILAAAICADKAEGTLDAVVGVEVLKILDRRVSYLVGGSNELICHTLRAERSLGHNNRAIFSMNRIRARTLICLKLQQVMAG